MGASWGAMLGKAPTPIVVAILGFGVVFAMPVAGAVSFGVDAASVPDMKAAGALPAYGQTWVGAWMRSSGWGGFESDLRTMRDNGVTPVVMWYYWGDGISVPCIQYGCNGNSKSNWDAMAREMASRAEGVLGSRTFLVVLEPEFNKNGVQDWETFDGHLEAQARAIKAEAPNARIVVGFGHWGGWDRFDRAAAASDHVGFQILRGSTRDSSAAAIAAADEMVRIGKSLRDRFGKSVVVFDLGIATYGGWEWVQEAALKQVLAKKADLDAAGVKLVVWRYVRDNTFSSGYFGPAESTWGVKYSWGGSKKGYDELVSLLRGSAPASSGVVSSFSSGSSAPAGSPFSNVKGNEWWVQANVAGSPTRMELRVDGGPWITMSKASWGAWTKSTHAPYGSVVELRATYGDGATRSASYRWPDAVPVGGASGGAFDATFSSIQVHEWWVQSSVKANEPVAKVEVRINGGAWVALTKQSWGAWAKSVHVPAGAKVEFRAASSSGATDVSSPVWR